MQVPQEKLIKKNHKLLFCYNQLLFQVVIRRYGYKLKLKLKRARIIKTFLKLLIRNPINNITLVSSQYLFITLVRRSWWFKILFRSRKVMEENNGSLNYLITKSLFASLTIQVMKILALIPMDLELKVALNSLMLL